jgi:cyclopropane-fatty-acyl-phospholipid synthase
MMARAVVSAVLRRLREGRLEVVENGRSRMFGLPEASLGVTITVSEPGFWTAALKGTPALARSFIQRGWDCDDLVSLVRIFAREMPRFDALRRPFVPFRNLLTRIPRNTRMAARRHVAAHYDLGNDMFKLFLDDSMTYSCAVFEDPGASLREAQEAKLDRACRKLELRPDDHLVEIGAGWGSLALHAAGNYGCRVTTTTISSEQHAVATERVREAGLDDRVEVVMRDYRDLRGCYSKLVSIEMIEAVGWQYFDTFFRNCSRLLAPDGLMLLQAITIDDRAYEIEKASRSFIREMIFPAGCLPSMEVISRCTAHATDMQVMDLEDITAHYPETLRRWRENWIAAAPAAERLGYDDSFRRLWELYLAWSEGGFRERRIQDVQVLLAKPAYRRSRENIRAEMASRSAAGPREASFASASRPPGPST